MKIQNKESREKREGVKTPGIWLSLQNLVMTPEHERRARVNLMAVPDILYWTKLTGRVGWWSSRTAQGHNIESTATMIHKAQSEDITVVGWNLYQKPKVPTSESISVRYRTSRGSIIYKRSSWSADISSLLSVTSPHRETRCGMSLWRTTAKWRTQEIVSLCQRTVDVKLYVLRRSN